MHTIVQKNIVEEKAISRPATNKTPFCAYCYFDAYHYLALNSPKKVRRHVK